VRLTYAMKTEGLEPSETALNCYLAGKRQRHKEWVLLNGNVSIMLENHYENILIVECSQFDVNDRRRMGDKKVRIIF